MSATELTPNLVEKYRPTTWEEVKGQDEIVRRLKEAIEVMKATGRRPPNMMFLGPPGTAKTTLAQLFTRALFGDTWRSYYTEINASDERGINVVRDRIKSLSELLGSRVVFLDEFDQMTPDAQFALRRIIEPDGGTDTIFILAANRESKVLDTMKSRCAIYRFQRLPDDILKSQLLRILKGEGMVITGSPEERQQLKDGFEYLVESSRGDLRFAINTLEQLMKADKKLTVKDIAFLQKSKVATEAMRTALKGDFDKAKELFETSYRSSGSDSVAICSELYEGITDLQVTEAKPAVRIRLFIKLAEIEGRIKDGSDAEIQLVAGFLAFCWIAPHLNDGVVGPN